jgi:hypothetical protein
LRPAVRETTGAWTCAASTRRDDSMSLVNFSRQSRLHTQPPILRGHQHKLTLFQFTWHPTAGVIDVCRPGSLCQSLWT